MIVLYKGNAARFLVLSYTPVKLNSESRYIGALAKQVTNIYFTWCVKMKNIWEVPVRHHLQPLHWAGITTDTLDYPSKPRCAHLCLVSMPSRAAGPCKGRLGLHRPLPAVPGDSSCPTTGHGCTHQVLIGSKLVLPRSKLSCSWQ